MAVASEQNNTVSVQNSVEIVFVDEDDLPQANLMEHLQADDDLDDDFELVQDKGRRRSRHTEQDTSSASWPAKRKHRVEQKHISSS